MRKPTKSLVWDVLTSLKLTIVCLAALMVLVVSCTLAQVSMGTFGAVEEFMRTWLVWWHVPGTEFAVAVFPGGAMVGLVLMVNLVAAQLRRLELSWRKAGIWITHAGLILLFVGEFVAGMFQVETQLAIEEGQTRNYVESPRDLELAVMDHADAARDDVWSVPLSRLLRGGRIELPGSPVAIQVHAAYRNSVLANRRPGDPPSPATAGVGTGVTVQEAPPVTRDDEMNAGAAFVEPVAGGHSYGTWLVSNVLGAPQSFVHEGHTYELRMRNRREYLPYSITLKEFRHDIYPGTDIPKSFSSLVRLDNPATGES
ncbi:MAG TPA: hypothetical protein VEP68_04800, partial [Anaeromyxobacteraceae bacterium]|nr:hypothetical protein [Anaeromyxobacteraceae bacterium]